MKSNSIRTFVAYILAGLICLSFAGSALAASTATVKIRSLPANAKVYINGYYRGRTPVTAHLSNTSTQGKSYKITVIASGYEKWTRTLTVKTGDAKTLTATLRKGTQTGSLKGKVICLDPGHPSEVSEGATGPDGTTEKHINWVIAQKVKALLVADGAKVILTKTSEKQRVTNRERAEIANRAKAALMLRLHCDSGPIDGTATYYPDQQGHKGGIKGPSEEILHRSKAAAHAFHPAYAQVLQGSITDRGTHGDSATLVGGQQGALTGSIFSKVPVLTIEMCVLSSRHDEAFIKTEAGQAKMARALKAGIIAAVAH